jgi:hypothetical protein
MENAMSLSRRHFISAAAAGAAAAAMPGAQAKPASRIKSISAMAFMPDGKLVIADWQAGQLIALDAPALPAAKETPLNLLNLSDRLANAYGTSATQLRVTAAAFQRESQTTALALTLGTHADASVHIAFVSAQGEVRKFDADSAIAATLALKQAPGDAQLWNKTPARSLFVTDLKAYGNELIVAGLTNTAFNSTLRRIPYPFTGAGTTTAVEMYHAVHNQIETRAPVRSFAVINAGGQPTLLAAYTCTPLVTVPMMQLKDGAKVRGKTIAELGFGNTPLDVLPFALEHKGQKSEWVLIANSAKAADLISLPDIVKASQSEGLNTPVKAPFEQHAGVKAVPVPLTNLQKAFDQGPQFLGALRRDTETGQLQLVSIRKGAFFRLSDHVNEYDFPTYSYPENDQFQQQYIRPFHRMMKGDEGHASLIK